MKLQDKVQTIKGVGEKKSALLKNLKVETRRKEKKHKELINWRWIRTIFIVSFLIINF